MKHGLALTCLVAFALGGGAPALAQVYNPPLEVSGGGSIACPMKATISAIIQYGPGRMPAVSGPLSYKFLALGNTPGNLVTGTLTPNQTQINASLPAIKGDNKVQFVIVRGPDATSGQPIAASNLEYTLACPTPGSLQMMGRYRGQL